MNRYGVAVLIALVALAGVVPAGAAATAGQSNQTPTCEYPLTVTDATNTEVTVESSPERVVATGASGAQTMWEIGAKDDVVGLPIGPYTTRLDGREGKTDVSNADGTLNVEQTLSAEPDVVLAANITASDKIQQLRSAGVTVYVFAAATSIEDIYRKTAMTGTLTDNCPGAADAGASMRERVEAVKAQVEGEESPSAFIHFGGRYTATNGSFVDNIVTTAGATNIVTELNASAYGRVSYESVVEANPEFIVVPVANDSVDAAAQLPEQYDSVAAVEEDQVIGVVSDNFSQPAPRVVQPLEVLADRFAAWEGPNETTVTTTESQTSESQTTEPQTTESAATTEDATESTATTETATTTDAPTTQATESGGTPGFGVPAAVAALAALLAIRRF